MNSQTIIFFDGVCHLCNNFVDFAIRADRKKKLRFASLQGENAKQRLEPKDLNSLETIIVLKNGKTYYRSQAVLLIFWDLGLPYSLLYFFRMIPWSGLDMVYNFVARNRYSWFGRRELCRRPSPGEKDSLLP